MAPVAPRFTLHHLEVLVAVGETGTVSSAAERLHMSPSAVSSALSELENRLGLSLLVRRRAKGATLTADGVVVLDRARTILDHAVNLQLGASESGPIRGHLRIGCFPTLGPTMLPALVTRFLNANPSVTVDFREGDQAQLRRWLAAGETDLAITYDIDVPMEWQTVRIASSSMYLTLAADHPLASEPGPVDLVALRSDPLVMLDLPPSGPRILEVCARSGFTPTVAYRTPSYETARSFVARGLGWTLLHQRLPIESSYEGLPLVSKDLGAPHPDPLGVVLAHVADVPLSRAAQGFLASAARE